MSMLPLDNEKLIKIHEYCREIEKTIARYGVSYSVFDEDSDFQRSVSFSLLQIGEISNGLSEEFRNETKSEIPWHAIRGMRNMVAHSYGSMSREVIWDTATNSIQSLKTFCEKYMTI